MDFSTLFEQFGQKKKFKRFEKIYEMGEDPKGIFCVREGLVGLVITTQSGSEQLLRLFKPGNFFGHRSILAGEKHHASAVALEETHVVFVDAQKLKEELFQSVEMSQRVIQTLAVELGRAEMLRMTVTESEVMNRVAEALIYLKELKPDHNWTRTEIANFCASTTPTVIRVLAELEERQLIQQLGRKIEILDKKGLLSLSQSEL